jgi:hypothetical protein
MTHRWALVYSADANVRASLTFTVPRFQVYVPACCNSSPLCARCVGQLCCLQRTVVSLLVCVTHQPQC